MSSIIFSTTEVQKYCNKKRSLDKSLVAQLAPPGVSNKVVKGSNQPSPFVTIKFIEPKKNKQHFSLLKLIILFF